MLDEGLEYAIRMATIDDAGTVARHRATMFLNMGVGWVCHRGDAIEAGGSSFDAGSSGLVPEQEIDQVTLAAPKEGRLLYEAFGFMPISEMKLTAAQPPA
jgi:hypothetical protein